MRDIMIDGNRHLPILPPSPSTHQRRMHAHQYPSWTAACDEWMVQFQTLKEMQRWMHNAAWKIATGIHLGYPTTQGTYLGFYLPWYMYMHLQPTQQEENNRALPTYRAHQQRTPNPTTTLDTDLEKIDTCSHHPSRRPSRNNNGVPPPGLPPEPPCV